MNRLSTLRMCPQAKCSRALAELTAPIFRSMLEDVVKSGRTESTNAFVV